MPIFLWVGRETPFITRPPLRRSGAVLEGTTPRAAKVEVSSFIHGSRLGSGRTATTRSAPSSRFSVVLADRYRGFRRRAILAQRDYHPHVVVGVVSLRRADSVALCVLIHAGHSATARRRHVVQRRRANPIRDSASGRVPGTSPVREPSSRLRTNARQVASAWALDTCIRRTGKAFQIDSDFGRLPRGCHVCAVTIAACPASCTFRSPPRSSCLFTRTCTDVPASTIRGRQSPRPPLLPLLRRGSGGSAPRPRTSPASRFAASSGVEVVRACARRSRPRIASTWA